MTTPAAGSSRGHLTPLARDGFAVLALLSLTALVFERVVFRGELLFDRDVHLFWLARTLSVARSLRAGAWPVWADEASFGEPLLELTTGFYYPPNWLALIFQPWTAYSILAMAHFTFAGLGLYLLARRLGTTRGAALCGALLWCLSGPLLSTLSLLGLLVGSAWIPWALIATDLALGSLRPTHAAAWGAAIAVPVLAGSETAFMVGPLSAAWASGRALHRTAVERRRTLAMALLALLFSIGFAAAQWVPFLGLAGRTSRAELSRDVRTHWSVPPRELARLALVPVDATTADGGLPYLYSIHVGVPALVLAAAAVAGRRRRFAALIASAAVAGACFALGRHGPFYDAVVAVFPPLQSLRFPVKGLILTGFCVALLAALGIDALRERRRGAIFAAAATASVCLLLAAWLQPAQPAGLTLDAGLAVASLAAVAAAALWQRTAFAAPLVLALVGVSSLYLVHRSLNPTAPVELYRYRPPTLDSILADGGSRTYFRPSTGRDRVAPGQTQAAAPDLPPSLAVAVAMRLYLYSPAAQIYGLATSFEEDVKGQHPVQLSRLAALLGSIDGTPAHVRLLQIGAVSHTVYLDAWGSSELEPVATFPNPMRNPVFVFRVPDPLPRAYAVGGARIARDQLALHTLVDPGFDPRREVVLESGRARPAPQAFLARVIPRERRAGRLSFDVELSHDGWFVVVETFDPYWRAEVDGHPEEVMRANTAFRAVPVPAGTHEIVLHYRPWTLTAGLLITGLAILGALALVVRERRRPGLIRHV